MNLLKNKKMVSLVVAGLVVVGGAGSAYAVQSHSSEQEVKQEASDQKGLELKFSTAINSIYLDKNQKLVKATIDQKEIDHAKELLKESKNKMVSLKLVSNLETAVAMAELQQNVNTLFESESVAKYSTDVEKTVPGIEKRLAKLDKKEFKTSQTEKVTIFKASYREADDTNKAVLALFDGEAVKEDVTREAYDLAKQHVDMLKQVELQKQLAEKLVLVDDKLKEKEQVVAAEAQKEAEVQEQAKQQQATSNQQAAATNGDNSSTAGYSGNTGSGGSTPSTGGSQQGNNGTSGTTNQQPSTPQTPPSNSNNGMKPGDTWNGNTTEGGLIGGQENAGNGGGGNTGGTIEW